MHRVERDIHVNGARMQIVNLSRDRLLEMEQIFCEALGLSPSGVNDGALQEYFDADRSWLAIDTDDRIAGLSGSFTTRLVLPGGRMLDGSAVAWFGVRVDCHGTGIGRALMEHQIANAIARGDAFLVLNSSQYPIYGRYGFGPTGRQWSIKVDPRRVRWRACAPVPGHVTVGNAPDVREQLVDCYARCFGAWPGEVDRHDGHWTRRQSPRPEDKGRRLWALLHDDAGVVIAAAQHAVEECQDDAGFANRLKVNDLFGVDQAAQVALWRWLFGRHLVGEVSCWRVDPGSALPDAMEDPHLLVTTGLVSATWLRILDVTRVLGGRSTLATGTVVLEILDPLIDAVAGVWRLTGDGERLMIERSDDAPDITVGIDALASLVFAHRTACRLAAAGRLVGAASQLDALDRLLTWPRPGWSSHMF